MTASISSKATQPITSLEIGRIAVLIPNCKDKTMTDKLMYIPMMIQKNTSSVDYKEWLKCLETQINKPTNQNLIKVHKSTKLLSQRIRKH